MDKLIELLNKYRFRVNIEYWYIDWAIKKRAKEPYFYEIKWDRRVKETNNICSKEFWFIKRLVDNDKIDLEEFTKKKSERFSSIYINNEPTKKEYYTECLLMLLSIQDNPIEFLVSVLK